MAYIFRQKVLFKHCDPAGIVFYPRYIEMINDCAEDFFDRAVQWPFETMLKTSGTPTVSTATEFQAPSRHGDQLILTLNVEQLGNSSLKLAINCYCSDEKRFSNKTTMVCVNDEGKPTPWPASVRTILETYKDDCNDS